MSPPALKLVDTLADVRESVNAFNAEPGPNGLKRDLLRSTSYWVQDAQTGDFGPSKFVGFRKMTFRRYAQAREEGSSAARFDGHVTRRRIEEVVNASFSEDAALAAALAKWAQTIVGQDVFAGIDPVKWSFVVVERDSKSGLREVQNEAGRTLDARFEVETLSGQRTVVVASRGGADSDPNKRNSEYAEGFVLILKRLQSAEAKIVEAVIETRATTALTRAERRLTGAGLRYPLRLDDPVAMKNALGAAQARIRAADAGGGGNRTKRVRMYLAFDAVVPLRAPRDGDHRFHGIVITGSSPS